ncbi:probable serine/threonine-protein kinase dyrk1 isoform X1 [Ricinus communis]|uniref:probable serine/threonine-protein kinase dyrk1 isoform X1 n=1 Tax=Ricinus communis TaxID=3988 RepID=UPI0007724263|nr:probable serine/threonine-protein kinase dyrk1 isoform X1 [Ricinus communis]|eukprot:XP_015583386.1 probable serine/threonine-protein kinase dyrk1 isoform X1 [Ricinus communis]
MATAEVEGETESAAIVHSPDIEAVMDFLRKNGLKEAELALKQDMIEKNELGSFDFEKFLFVLPPVKIPASFRPSEVIAGGGDEGSKSNSGSVSDDEFVSLGSSTSDLCSSEFTNPYGLRSASQANSETSSDRLSQFGTARDYPDFDLQNDFYWYDEKDEGNFMTPSFNALDYLGGPSEDKFVMTSETVNQSENSLGLYGNTEEFEVEANDDYLDQPCLFNMKSSKDKSEAQAMDYYHFDKVRHPEGNVDRNDSSAALCKCCAGAGGMYDGCPTDQIFLSSKVTDSTDYQLKFGDFPTDYDVATVNRKSKDSNYDSNSHSRGDWFESYKNLSEIKPNGIANYIVGEANEEADELRATEEEEDGEVNTNDLLMLDAQEDEYEVFDLRIIHRKNRTGFEENKDLPIVLNTVIAGRYYVTEYLGSAAFSKVVQAHDLYTGIDVCLKIIKNDKDFFDQSLDEIKLLKLVNKHDPADERHIIRLYDYFYHQEHLFIVCELLRANLYEFQKFNQESGGEPYFTLSRLQVITRQCLEALEYLHHLGIIHCDLKPENILIKSYRRCEIKVIDLGSSCFQSDNLCLYVQSRSYRAPEVILGLPYDQKIDLWSLGCILAELCSGEVLFPNDAVVMILARVIGMLGPIDLEMLVRGQETHKYFTTEYDLYYVNEEKNQIEYIIPEESSLEHHLQTSDVEFIDFVKSLLEVNPVRRPTAREALEHPWLLYSYESNSH